MILVRHAQPDIDPTAPAAEWRLSATGRRQCATLATHLRELAPDALFSSPEPKARETADLLGGALGLPVVEISGLREHDRRGVGHFASQREFERRVCALLRTPDRLVFGNESGSACLARFRGGIAEVLRHAHRQPIVVSHGTVLSLYLAEETGLDAEVLWRSMGTACYAVLAGDVRTFEGVRNVPATDCRHTAATEPASSPRPAASE